MGNFKSEFWSSQLENSGKSRILFFGEKKRKVEHVLGFCWACARFLLSICLMLCSIFMQLDFLGWAWENQILLGWANTLLRADAHVLCNWPNVSYVFIKMKYLKNYSYWSYTLWFWINLIDKYFSRKSRLQISLKIIQLLTNHFLLTKYFSNSTLIR